MKCSFAVVAAVVLMQTIVANADSGAAGMCSAVPGSQQCIDATPCKTFADGQLVCLAGAASPDGAAAVPQTCWSYSYEYACENAAATSTCAPYEINADCTVVKSACTDQNSETGVCSAWNYSYQCLTAPAVTENKLTCSSTIFDTTALTAPPNQNANFAKAALAMEITRETQIYAQTNQPIFNGVPEACTKGYFGLHNCCTGTPGAVSNRDFLAHIAGNAAFSVAKYAGEKLIDTASPYVFDAMYQNASFFSNGIIASVENAAYVTQLDAAGGWATAIGTNFASQGLTLSAYGFTYGTGTLDMATAMPGTMDMSGTFGMSGTDGFVTFNPYVFAGELALQYLMSLTQCSPDENIFQMHKGADLSVFISEECSKKVLFSCVEHKQHYCSFNSVLAKIVNTQGKAQMGLDVSNCSGLSPEQVTQLDFTRIDFSEFTDKLLSEAQAGLPTNVQGNYTPIMQKTSQGVLQSLGNGLAYPPGAAPGAAPPTTP